MTRSPRLFRVLLLTACSLVPAFAAQAAVLTNYVLQWGTLGTGNGQFDRCVTATAQPFTIQQQGPP